MIFGKMLKQFCFILSQLCYLFGTFIVSGGLFDPISQAEGIGVSDDRNEEIHK
jgi:hypothetical protein